MRLKIEAANGVVAVQDGIIVTADGVFDRTFRIPDGFVRAGLINAHDHLHRNHYGRLGAGPYVNAYLWAADIQRRSRDAIAAGRSVPRRQALLRGAWKNLLSGVTHVVHHDPWEADFDRDFPLHVVPLATADSLGHAGGFAPPAKGSFALHLAEGTDAAAADEVRQLGRMGGVHDRLIAVHAVGADSDGIARLRDGGAAVTWCPSSNLFLLGRTAPAALLAEGMDVLLGSDSRLSGDGDLLDELACARGLGLLSDARLLDAVGPLAARRLGLHPPTLALGAKADLLVSRKPLLECRAGDIALVMAQGVLRVLDPELGLPPHGRLHGGRWIASEEDF